MNGRRAFGDLPARPWPRIPFRARRAAVVAAAAAGALLPVLGWASPALGLERALTAPDGGAGDSLGLAVAVDGDTAVAGAPLVSKGRGAVYVFSRVGNEWVFKARLAASDGAQNDRLGSSVAIDGDTIIAGAPYHTVGGNTTQGAAYTFTRGGAKVRTQTAELTASDGAGGDFLGFSVGLAGQTIVAGSPNDNLANPNQGSVYTFARTGAPARTQTAKLTASDGAANDQLGFSVAAAGETIVAGASGDDVGFNTDQGSVCTFTRSGPAARPQTAKLTASDGAANDQLGGSVAVAGQTIVAGAGTADRPSRAPKRVGVTAGRRAISGPSRRRGRGAGRTGRGRSVLWRVAGCRP